LFETIESDSRQTMDDMREIVGLLRGGEVTLAPAPTVAHLDALLARHRSPQSRLTVSGDPRSLPATIELSAYRIVQEALTNALKHAGRAHASVAVRYGPDSLELEILDDGPGSEAAVPGGGHGLVGMRERVALYGGRFDARGEPGGGFAVRVLLPVR
jgi:signal transduction histidine kinase